MKMLPVAILAISSAYAGTGLIARAAKPAHEQAGVPPPVAAPADQERASAAQATQAVQPKHDSTPILPARVGQNVPGAQANLDGSRAARSGTSEMTQPDWAAAPTAAPLGAQPSPRGNPITRAQALNRIYTRGYSDISDLWLDQSGIWRGHAIKDGRKVTVWLDHMGNVGQRR